jgi:translation initiation factor IF-2
MLEPKLKKVFVGKAEVRKVFKLSRSGTVAGCFVTKGKITRNVLVNLVRNGDVVFEGKLSSLKRFKDDVREVMEGFECGMTISGFEDLKEGDIIEAYDIEKIARKL